MIDKQHDFCTAQNVESFKDLFEKKKTSGGFSAAFTELLIILMYCPICGKEFGEIFQFLCFSRSSFKWAHCMYCFLYKRFQEVLTLGVEKKRVKLAVLCLAALLWGMGA